MVELNDLLNNKSETKLFGKSPTCKKLLEEIIEKANFKEFKANTVKKEYKLAILLEKIIKSYFTINKLEDIIKNTIEGNEYIHFCEQNEFIEFLEDCKERSIIELNDPNSTYDKIYNAFYLKTVSEDFIKKEDIKELEFLESINPFDQELKSDDNKVYSVVFLMNCFMGAVNDINKIVTGFSEGTKDRSFADVIKSWNKLGQVPIVFHDWKEDETNKLIVKCKKNNLHVNFVSIIDEKKLFFALYNKQLPNEFKELQRLCEKIKYKNKCSVNRALRYAAVNTLRLALMGIIAEELEFCNLQITYADMTVIPYPEMLLKEEDKFKRHNLRRTDPYRSFSANGMHLENTCMIYNKPKDKNLFTDDSVLFLNFLKTAKNFIEFYSTTQYIRSLSKLQK